MRVLIIENFVGTPPGQVGRELAHAGIATEVRRTFQGDGVPEAPDGYAGLVVLGGAQSARDDAGHPTLPRIAALMRQFGDADRPVLGICLGAQLLGRHSDEGDAAGLGWIEMDIVPFDRSRLAAPDKVPHMGWADTACRQHPLFDGLEDPRFYYVHSFHFACDAADEVLCGATHGYEFASGVGRGAILGVQFHPEKSHVFGRRLLKNWAEMSFAPA
jgi:imidazole glycerol phosphate synthase glutamine amidotransferase subunit